LFILSLRPVAEKPPEKIVLPEGTKRHVSSRKRLRFYGFCGADVYNGRSQFFRQIGEGRIKPAFRSDIRETKSRQYHTEQRDQKNLHPVLVASAKIFTISHFKVSLKNFILLIFPDIPLNRIIV
jgi:hypothetical protein